MKEEIKLLNILRPFLFLILFAISSLCDAGEKSGELPVMANSSFELTKKEEARLLIKGRNGDVAAANRLAMYYDFVAFDSEKAIFWLRKTAQSGIAQAQYNMAVRISGIDNQACQAEAMYWLKLADENGQPLARPALERLEKRNPGIQPMQTPPDAENECK